MDRVINFPFKSALGTIRRIIPELILRIVEHRARFQKSLSGKVVVEREVQGLKQVTFAGQNAVGYASRFAGEIKVGYATTIGSFNHIVGPVSIGNYCQFGPAVAIYGKEHPTQHITPYFNQCLFRGRLKRHAVIAETQIGHDVWLGHGAIVLKGVKIGTGAIIGAGAVVTKDVPNYAIAVGNPARVVRMRFDNESIEILMGSRWWLKSVKELEPFEELFHLDLGKEKAKVLAGLKQMPRQSC